jgi:hypothetical protein
MNTPKRKYSFYDIVIFKKTPKGYVDFTNFSFDDKYYFDTKAYHNFSTDSPYLIALWFGYQYLIAPVTVSEMLILANIKDNSSFIMQCRYGMDATRADDIIAMMCANKIANHRYGSISLKYDSVPDGHSHICDTITYEFMRKKSVSGKRVFTLLLEKTFKIGG